MPLSRPPRRRLFSVCLLSRLLAFGAVFATPAPAQTYSWDSVKVGGGGYLTGQAIHPAETSLHYVRGDVSGLHRWDAAAGRWHSLLDWVSPDSANLYGCDGLALDPGNPDLIYAVFGKYPDQSPSGLYKSSDRGATWTQVLSKKAAANLDHRWLGECVVVVPDAPSTVLYGTRTDGLWRSTDAGASWSKVSGVPNGVVGDSANYSANPPVGVRSLVAQGSVVYAAVWGTGVYRSTNAGATWTSLSGAPAKPAQLRLAANGHLYVTHESGVSRFDGSAWGDVTPPGQAGKAFVALALRPSAAEAKAGGVRNGNLESSALGATSFSSPEGDLFATGAAQALVVASPFSDGGARAGQVSVSAANYSDVGCYYSPSQAALRLTNGVSYEAVGKLRVESGQVQVKLADTATGYASPQSRSSAVFTSSSGDQGFALRFTYRGGDVALQVQFPASAGGRVILDNIDIRPVAPEVLASRYAYDFNQALYRSTDGGATWSGDIAAGASLQPEAGWWPGYFRFAATASLAFDAGAAGAAFHSDWYGLWRSAAPGAAQPVWASRLNGLESSVSLFLCAPPSGAPLFSGFADITGFRHADVGAAPASQLIADAASTVSLDYCETSAASLALIVTDSWNGTGTELHTSTNGGDTWMKRTLPPGAKLGRVAVSSGAGGRMVYVPAGGARPFYSSDGGATWKSASSGYGSGAILSKETIFDYNQPLVADRVTSGRFFFYRSGRIYRSTDSGVTWTEANPNSRLPSAGDYAVLLSPPGLANELWVSLGWNGLHRSTNSGASFSAVGAFTSARAVAAGKAPAGSTVPAIYVYGKRSDQWGLWRTLDRGSTWTRLNDDTHLFGNDPRVLAADRQTYGRVYIGTNGKGVVRGEPAP